MGRRHPVRKGTPVRTLGRATAATLTIIAVLSVGASAAASPRSPATAKTAAPATIDPDKHPVTDPAQITRNRPMPQPRSAAVQSAREWVAEEPSARFACFTSDGALATVGIVDRVDPTRPLTADQIVRICREGHPGTSG